MYNELLSTLPVYEAACKRVAISLERKLTKDGLYQAFTNCVEEFIEKGVLKYPEPRLNNLQRSFIPLTYTLRKGGTTPLRVCGNSSFRSGDNLTLNECALSGPNFLQNLGHILVRWRSFQKIATGDISRCYHQIMTSDKDNSLRRTFVKRRGDDKWSEVCFGIASFGDIQAGPISSLAIQ